MVRSDRGSATAEPVAAADRTSTESVHLLDAVADAVVVFEPLPGDEATPHTFRSSWRNAAADALLAAFPLGEEASHDAAGIYPLLDALYPILVRAWHGERVVRMLSNTGRLSFPRLRPELVEVTAVRSGDRVAVTIADRGQQHTLARVLDGTFAHLEEGALVLLPQIRAGEVIDFHVTHANPAARRLLTLPVELPAVLATSADDELGARALVLEAWRSGTAGPVMVDNRDGHLAGVGPAAVTARAVRTASTVTLLLQDRTAMAEAGDRAAAGAARFAGALRGVVERVLVCEPVLGPDGSVVDAGVVFDNWAGHPTARRLAEPMDAGVLTSLVARARSGDGPVGLTLDRERSVLEATAWAEGDAVVVMVTDRAAEQRLVADLQEAEARYRLVADAVPAAVYIMSVGDEDLSDVRIVHANATAARVLGSDPTGMHPADVMRLWNVVGKELAREAWQRGSAQRTIDHADPRHGDAPSRVLQVGMRRMGRLVVMVASDLTAATAAERSRARTDLQIATVLDSLTEGVVLHAADGTVVAANAAMDRLLGHTVPDASDGPAGVEPARLLDPTGRPLSPWERPWHRTVRSHSPFAGELVQWTDPSGRRVWAEVRSAVVPLADGSDGAVVTYRDVTTGVESDERFHAVVDRLDAGVAVFEPVLDDAGTVVDLRLLHNNPAADALRDQPPVPGDLASATFANWPMALLRVQRVWATGESERYDLHNEGAGRDGDLHPVHVELTVHRAGRLVIIVGVDRTDRRVAADALVAADEMFRSTVDALEEAVDVYEPVLLDGGELADLRLVHQNPASRSMREAPLPAGALASEVWHDVEASLAVASQVWHTGQSARYTMEHLDDPAFAPRHLDIVQHRAGQVLVVVGRDRTESMAERRARLEAERRFADTLGSMEQEIAVYAPVIVDEAIEDLRLVYGNPAWFRGHQPPLPAHMRPLVRDIFPDAHDFIEQVRVAWHRGEPVTYVVDNPDRARIPTMRAEYLQSRITRVGDEITVVAVDRSQEHRAVERLRDLAAHDHETGLLSRSGLSVRLADTLNAGTSVGLVLLEATGLDLVQRSYGLGPAERALQETARRLQRESGSSAVARVGASSFVVALAGVRRIGDVTTMAERLVELTQRPLDADGTMLRLDTSAGTVLSPLHGSDLDTLIRRAKAAAWFGMRSRQRCTIWTAQLEQAHVPEISLLSEVERGMANGEFFVHVQPKVRLADRALVGAEALVRWNHPERGVIPPNRFIPVLEDSTLARPFTQQVITMALTAWRARPELDGMRVAVNLPPALANDPALVDVVTDALLVAAVPATSLELEITERGLVATDVEVRANLAELRSLGVTLAIDDFGTGAASLSYLRDLPVDVVKIDRTFISELERDRVNRSIVEACVTVARAVDLDVVAEGVETEAEARAAAELGCQYAQGYLFGRPGPIEDLAAWDTSR